MFSSTFFFEFCRTHFHVLLPLLDRPLWFHWVCNILSFPPHTGSAITSFSTILTVKAGRIIHKALNGSFCCKQHLHVPILADGGNDSLSNGRAINLISSQFYASVLAFPVFPGENCLGLLHVASCVLELQVVEVCCSAFLIAV